MNEENRIQALVHKLEQGGWASWIRRLLLVAAIAYVASLWMFQDSGFKGLSHEKAMEQAQISREIARGNGFSTKMIRPAALWQFQAKKGALPIENIPDTYHAPLNPYINSVFLLLVKKSWLLTHKDLIYICDKVLVSVQLVFFLLATLVNYFTAKRLFDKRLALLGTGLLLICELFWDFSMSGLPQMLMLFIFSAAGYVMVRLTEAHAQGISKLRWSAALGALFGLLALAHGLTLFIFLGALVFAAFAFRPWGRDAAIILAVCALFYVPWMVRNYRVCGSPVGIGWYSGLAQISGSESKIMRTMSLDETLKDAYPRNFTLKLRTQLMDQFSDIYRALGSIVVAPVFFLALLHVFRRPETALFRWWILCMWLFAAFGMAAVGLEPFEQFISATSVKANDLNVLFIPLMTFYGLAFVLVLWNRLEISNNLSRYGFFTLLFLISGIPFLVQFIELQKQPTSRVQWPPYVPPSIAMLNTWTRPNEIIMSDMPWAVAWYADRKSLWVPMTIRDFITLADWEHLGGRIIGLYLTPITGNKPFLAGVAKGEYREWAPFIMRQGGSLKDFPLHAMTGMDIERECVFYADRDRWSAVED